MWSRSLFALAEVFEFGVLLGAQTAPSANASKLVGSVSDATGGVMVNLDVQLTTGDALLDLPDNPDDLLTYLLQLPQLRGGEGDVTINVDGFNGADIPPLAQIGEIRIVNISFTADGSAGPRISVTRRWRQDWSPGSCLHLRFFHHSQH